VVLCLHTVQWQDTVDNSLRQPDAGGHAAGCADLHTLGDYCLVSLFPVHVFTFIVAGPIELWSFFSNVLSYVLLVLMFLAEFTVRRLVVHEHMDYSFAEFLQRLKNVNFRSVLK
jgi:predicted permease